MTRAHASLACLLLLLAGSGCGLHPSPRPNILLIVVDTLRTERLGCYGAERDTSPYIDALAADAYRFERAYTTSPWTQPSVASMLTGLYPSSHGVVRIGIRLPDSVPTLAEILRERGYATGAVVSVGLLGRHFGFDRGFEAFDEGEAFGARHVSSPAVTRRAISLLDAFAAEQRPFFLFVHYFDPHYAYQRHPEIGFAADGAGRLRGGEPVDRLRFMLDDLTPEELGFLLDLYDEEVRFTDEAIGRLLARLRRLGLYENTLIVLVADHGEEFLERGWIGHTRTLYEELVRVPFLLRVPGLPNGGRVLTQPVSVASLLPTLVELAGVEAPRVEIQAASLAPLLDAPAERELEPVFVEVDFDPRSRHHRELKTAHKKAIVTERFKLVRDDRSGQLELFDLARDPGETVNLVESRPELTRSLLASLEARIAHARGLPTAVQEATLSSDQLELLRELGYVESEQDASPP